MTSLPLARSFDWSNFALRLTSGIILGSASLAAVWVFDWPNPLWRSPFLVLISIAGVLLSIEWSTMATPAAKWRAVLMTSAAVVAVILLTFAGHYVWAWACVVAGAIATAVVTKNSAERATDGAYGVLYIAPACLALVWLIASPQGPGWTLMLFAVTWGADVSAFLVGNALKGPKLWPRYSPNKTWSGFFGGLLGAVIAAVAVAASLMHLSLLGAGLIGFAGGLATMAGDLWESMLKRRFGVKDSGDIIPGHGGLLDRVDGLMFAVMVFAVARLVVKFGWAH
jgi:phosphatidate cytidylyltransferase